MAIDERNVFWDWSDPAQRADLARYVLENLNEVVKIVKEAEEDLKNIPPWHDPSFDGYDSGEPERVRAQVKAIFQRLQKGKPRAGKYLTYRVEPPDSPKGRQRLRLAREILHWGHSECLGWVLLFAACVLHVRINPLVIITRNKETGGVHALLGYWLYELNFDQVVVDGKNVESNLSHGYIKAVNATRIAVDEEGGTRSFEEAESEAHGGLLPPCNPDWEILFAVDLRKAREEGIKPLLPLDPWSRNHTLSPAEHFQQRPELEKIKDWWRNEGSYGVLALVGIGGAGKTALVHRFLAQLPMSGIQEAGVEKDETLPILDALFVWSFYEHPDIDQCATALYNYLTDGQVSKATFEQVQEVLSKNWRGCRVLLVFDGVERLQIAPGIEPEEEGGTFGQFLPECAPLGRFLQWCCDRPRPVHVLITSRYSLTDLRRYEAVGGYRPVGIGELPRESARALLKKALGRDDIPDTDPGLNGLIEEFGNHAQTLNLLGNALRIWCDSDPTRVQELPSLEDVKKLAALRDKVWERVRVLRFYEQKLPKAILIVLQLLCAFRVIPVDDQLFTDIFLKEEPIECRIFASILGLTQKELKGHLLSLCQEYNLIQGKPKDSPKWFSVHPSIREYFYQRLCFLQKETLHKCIWKRLESLRGVPPFPALVKERDLESLDPDLLEELVSHTLRSGYATLAIRYFLGYCSYEHFGKKLGAYSRGERILREFVSKEDPTSLPMGLPEFEQGYFFNERALFLRSLGELDKAAYYFEQSGRIAKKNERGRRAMGEPCKCLRGPNEFIGNSTAPRSIGKSYRSHKASS